MNISALIAQNETLTSLSQNITTGIISYTDEDGAISTANVVSTNSNNLLTVGTDGGALLSGSGLDETDDAWINNSANTRIELGTQSDGTTARTAGTEVVVRDNGYFGLGTAAPISRIHLMSSGSFDNSSDDFYIETYSDVISPSLITYKARGTSAAPTNLQNGDIIGELHFTHLSGGLQNWSTRIESRYVGDGTTNLTNMSFRTSNEERFRIGETGNLLFTSYPSFRNDSGVTPVSNLLYTDASGNVLSAPIATAITAGTTHTLSNPANTITSVVNGVSVTAPAVNTVDATLSGTNLNVMVNGVVDTTPVDLSPLAVEPWFVQSGVVPATTDAQAIYHTGQVAIGQNAMFGSPGEMLAVNGTIRTASSVYADYVFEDYFKGVSTIKKDYKFKTLKEVEAYVKENNHLPGVTSIKDLLKTKEGYSFNLTELSIQSLEKLEELYLHVIDQQKLIDAKDIEMEVLRDKVKLMNGRLEEIESLLKANK